jgi:hypothetical protein
MSVKLNCPPKPEESQKNLNFNGKIIPYPGLEPGTSGLAVGSHNHCHWDGDHVNIYSNFIQMFSETRSAILRTFNCNFAVKSSIQVNRCFKQGQNNFISSYSLFFNPQKLLKTTMNKSVLVGKHCETQQSRKYMKKSG